MVSERAPNDILVVTRSPRITELLRELLPPRAIGSVTASDSCAGARRAMLDRAWDVIVINAPLPDEFGSELALEAVRSGGASAVLIAPREVSEEAAAKLEPWGVLVLQKPLTRSALRTVMGLALAVRQRLRSLEEENRKLNARLGELRLVNRAKWALIERRGMTEEQAHRYIEKLAMDRRVSKRLAAESVLQECQPKTFGEGRGANE